MLLLVTVALVFAGLVLLIVGFVQDSLSLIYLSIGCAAVAGVALIVFSRLSRRRAVRLAIEGVPAAAAPASPLLTRPRDESAGLRPRPAPERQPAPAYQPMPEPEPVSARAEVALPGEYEPEEEFEPTAPQPVQPVPSFGREPAPQFAHAGARDAQAPDHWEESGDWEEEWGDEVVFPIEDYDDLRVAEILPLLPQLEADELEDVRDREVNTKARATIVAKIDELLGRVPQAAAPGPARAPAAATPLGSAASPTARRAPAGRTAAAASKQAATPRKAAASSTGVPSKTAGTPAKATSRSSSTAAKKAAVSTKAAAAGKGATAKKAAVSKTPASKAATASKAAASKAGAGKAVAGKTAAGKAAPSKAAAKTTKAAPSKAAQPAKKAAAKKSTGQPATPPRKR